MTKGMTKPTHGYPPEHDGLSHRDRKAAAPPTLTTTAVA